MSTPAMGPWIPYLIGALFVALALNLIVVVYLFTDVKDELRQALRRVAFRLDRVDEPKTAAPPQPEEVYVPIPSCAGFDVTRRTRVLRLLKRGEPASRIAATLGIPKGEVELLERVRALIPGS